MATTCAPEPTVFGTRRRLPHPPAAAYDAFAHADRLAAVLAAGART